MSMSEKNVPREEKSKCTTPLAQSRKCKVASLVEEPMEKVVGLRSSADQGM
jgi:hypothetical protein